VSEHTVNNFHSNLSISPEKFQGQVHQVEFWCSTCS